MKKIISLIDSLCLSKTTNIQLVLIIEAMLSMSGRVTMLGLSRWTEKGGSYRTIQRFFSRNHSWATWRWKLIKAQCSHCFKRDIWVLAGDEVVVTKSGKKTHGLGFFFFNSRENSPKSLLY